MTHRPHGLEGMKGKFWIFSAKQSMKAAEKSLLGDQNLEERLHNSGCYFFVGLYGQKDQMFVFVYCSGTEEEAINEVARLMEINGGREATKKELSERARKVLLSAVYEKGIRLTSIPPTGKWH